MKIDGKEIKYLYMMVTTDRYELPIVVADSIKEMSEMTGIKAGTLSVYFSLNRPGFVKVDVSDED